jgi:biotin operon repressor
MLKTTEAMRAHHRDWVAAHYAPLTVICPQYDYSLAIQRDPAFQTIYARTAVPFLPLAGKLHSAVPEIFVFLNHAGGFMIMATLLQAAMAQEHPHAAVPYGDIGDRFGISRTQVRKLLTAAQDIGLVKLHARGGHRVEILPRLWECGDRGMAGGMFIHDMVYVMATAQLAAVPPPRLAPPLPQIAAKQA